MYKLRYSARFKKDLKKIQNNSGFPFAEFRHVIDILLSDKKLDKKYRAHKLRGEWNNYSECHIKPNLLLIYEVDKQSNILYIFRIGSHSELF